MGPKQTHLRCCRRSVKGRAGGGNSAALAAMMDRMDRSDTLGGVLEALMDILGAVLNGTDAQVRTHEAPLR